MKQLMILILIFPLITFSQTEKLKYEKVIEYVVDSIVKNDLDNFYISDLIERKTEFADFHGISQNCETQHMLLVEVLLNGEQSEISESELSDLIPDKFEPEPNKSKIELGTIITYKNIWATVIVIRNDSKGKHGWTKYSLLFINDKLAGNLIGKWHGD